MKTIYMKIHSFEETSNSLIVSFASDTTKYQDPNKYPSYAYQPLKMWPDISDPEEIKKRIAVSGMYQAQMQEQEEKFVDDPQNVQKYKDLVGQEGFYPVEELAPTQDPIIEV